MTDICSMCGDEPATVMDRWPLPVCADCDEWLDTVGEDLDDLEAADPVLAQLAFDLANALYRAPMEDVRVDPRYL